jgi:outer membrane protein assembly factor BamB
MKIRMIAVVYTICILSICVQNGIAEEFDWPRWRGPKGNGISLETDWNPEALDGSPEVLWRANVGTGYSNIAIADNRLFTMGTQRGGNYVFCLNAETGEEIWKYVIDEVKDPQSTPTVDGKYVYVLTRDGVLVCLKVKNGKLRWKKDLVSELGVVKPFYGFAGSPVIVGILVILTANTSGIGLNKKTGEVVWDSEKPTEALRLSRSTGTHYATPVVYESEGKRYAVITSSVGIHSADVESGNVSWSYEWEEYTNIQVSDPLIFDGKVFIAQYDGRGSFLLNIKAGPPEVLWQNLNMSSDNSSPVFIDGYLYGIDGGIEVHHASLRCLDVETGDVMWEKDMETNSISLMAADGKLILLEEDGSLRIAEAHPTSYREISSGNIHEHEIMGPKYWTTPVLYNGKIYCRNYGFDLVCVDVSR